MTGRQRQCRFHPRGVGDLEVVVGGRRVVADEKLQQRVGLAAEQQLHRLAHQPDLVAVVDEAEQLGLPFGGDVEVFGVEVGHRRRDVLERVHVVHRIGDDGLQILGPASVVGEGDLGGVDQVGVVVERTRVVQHPVGDAVVPVDVVVADGHLAGEASDLVAGRVGHGEPRLERRGVVAEPAHRAGDHSIGQLMADGLRGCEQIAGVGRHLLGRDVDHHETRALARIGVGAIGPVHEHIPLGAGATDDHPAAAVVEVEGEEVAALLRIGFEEASGCQAEPLREFVGFECLHCRLVAELPADVHRPGCGRRVVEFALHQEVEPGGVAGVVHVLGVVVGLHAHEELLEDVARGEQFVGRRAQRCGRQRHHHPAQVAHQRRADGEWLGERRVGLLCVPVERVVRVDELGGVGGVEHQLAADGVGLDVERAGDDRGTAQRPVGTCVAEQAGETVGVRQFGVGRHGAGREGVNERGNGTGAGGSAVDDIEHRLDRRLCAGHQHALGQEHEVVAGVVGEQGVVVAVGAGGRERATSQQVAEGVSSHPGQQELSVGRVGGVGQQRRGHHARRVDGGGAVAEGGEHVAHHRVDAVVVQHLGRRVERGEVDRGEATCVGGQVSREEGDVLGVATVAGGRDGGGRFAGSVGGRSCGGRLVGVAGAGGDQRADHREGHHVRPRPGSAAAHVRPSSVGSWRLAGVQRYFPILTRPCRFVRAACGRWPRRRAVSAGRSV